MSGGSFNYLCFANSLEDLAAKRHDLQAMYDRLAGLPWARVPAAETARLIAALDRLSIRIETSQELFEVWKTIEWWDSGDWSEETARQTVRDYEDLLLGKDA